MSDVKWSNLETAPPFCACVIEDALMQPTTLPEFIRRPFDDMIREKYGALYTADGECVEHGNFVVEEPKDE
jgi:hypothetical protein